VTCNVATAKEAAVGIFSKFCAVFETRSGTTPAFELYGIFKLAMGSSPFDPTRQTLAILVGSFFQIIPSGSFATTEDGRYVFRGVVQDGTMNFEIRLSRDDIAEPADAREKSFWFHIVATGFDLSRLVAPIPVSLAIGDSFGLTTAKIAAKGSDNPVPSESSQTKPKNTTHYSCEGFSFC
jgi:hypothetical protein